MQQLILYICLFIISQWFLIFNHAIIIVSYKSGADGSHL
jgi:hypothetical protein